jgi:flagellar motor switch protein FliM
MFIPQRPLTMIEQRLVGRITDRALVALTEAWTDLTEVEFKIAEVESNPHLVQIVAPNEIVIVVGFEIKMTGRAGTMSLCVPFKMVEPVMGRLVTQGWLAYQRQGEVDDKSEDIARGIGATSVNLDAYLAETTITVDDLLNLQPGDILQTPKEVDGEVVLQVHGENQFAGVIGRHKDNLAVKITRRAEVEEPL